MRTDELQTVIGLVGMAMGLLIFLIMVQVLPEVLG